MEAVLAYSSSSYCIDVLDRCVTLKWPQLISQL